MGRVGEAAAEMDRVWIESGRGNLRWAEPRCSFWEMTSKTTWGHVVTTGYQVLSQTFEEEMG